MKRSSYSITKRQLNYPFQNSTSPFEVDEYVSPKKENVCRTNKRVRRSLGYDSNDDWNRRMDGFDGLNDKTSENEPKIRQKSDKFRQASASAGQTLDAIDDSWGSSEDETSAVISHKKTSSRKNSKRKQNCFPCKNLTSKSFGQHSQESTLPSIENIPSSSSLGSRENPPNYITENGHDEAESDIADFDSDFDESILQDELRSSDNEFMSDESMSPVISVPKTQSPEPVTLTSATKSKASDWLKDVQWRKTTPEKPPGEVPAVEDSAKKKKQKYQKDGLAASLQRLLQHEKSSMAFWNHKLIQSNNTADQDNRKMVTVHIASFRNYPSLVSASAYVQGPIGDGKGLTDHENVTVVFAKSVFKERGFKSGSVVTIHTPWQLLHKPCGEKIMLCTSRSQLIGQKAAATDITPNVLKRNPEDVVAEWKCPCVRTLHHAPLQCPAHTQPVVIPRSVKHHSTGRSVDEAPNLECVQPNPTHMETRVTRSILESIERSGGGLNEPIHFLATIQRVFQTSDQKRGSLVHGLHHRGCCLLVQDFCGFVCELLVPPGMEDKDPWNSSVQNEGETFQFNGIRIKQRLNKSLSPRMFSIIESVWRPEAVLEKPEASQDTSQESDRGPELHSPIFTYVLQATPGDYGCKHKPMKESRSVYTPRKVVTVQESWQLLKMNKFARVDFDVQVLYLEQNSSSDRQRLYVSDHGAPLGLWITLGSDGMDSLASPCRVTFRDVLLHEGQCVLDEYSSVVSQERRTVDVSPPLNLLPSLSAEAQPDHIYKIQGEICGVEESTAYTWMTCPVCNDDKLQGGTGKVPVFYCNICRSNIETPVQRINLEVYVRVPGCDLPPVKIKLLQDFIEQLLADQEDDDGYEIQCVLRKTIGPIAVLVSVPQNLEGTVQLSTEHISLLGGPNDLVEGNRCSL